MLTGHTRIIVLFFKQLSGEFTAMGNLELRRLIPRQTCSIFGVQ
jgi:hypothetical protein